MGSQAQDRAADEMVYSVAVFMRPEGEAVDMAVQVAAAAVR
jgi:hypothetical protein